MRKLKLALITIGMCVVWIGTGGLLLGTTNPKGAASVLAVGVGLNVVLALYCRRLEQPPVRRNTLAAE